MKMKRLINKYARTDIGNREMAICYINGKLYEGNTHAEAINDFLIANNKELNDKYGRPLVEYLSDDDFNDLLGYFIYDGRYEINEEDIDDLETIKESINSLAFAHLMYDYTIRLETNTLYNCNINDVALTLKQEYPDYDILDDCDTTERRIAKNTFKRLIQKNATDITDRKNAILYINGEIFEGYTHGKCLSMYIFNNYGEKLNDSHFRPKVFDILKNYFDDLDGYEDEKLIQKYVKSIAFAHLMNDHTIKLETDTLVNCNVNDVALAIKKSYPDYDILDDCSINEKKIAIFKNAEFDGGFKKDYSYYEVYKNPTSSEIEEIKNNSKYNAIRGVIYDDGTVYAWDGDICHIYINKFFKSHPININTFRFCYENEKWLIDLDGMMSVENAYEKIYNYRNILSQFGDINAKFQLVDPYDVFLLEDYITDNGLVANLNKRLLKNSQYVHCHNCGWDNNDFLLNDDGSKNGWADSMQDRKFKRLYKEQTYHSLKEFNEKNPNAICPECGAQELDID